MVLYKVTNLDYEIDGRMLFSDISFDIKSESIYEIRGANGSGKSTLLKIIAGLISSNSLVTSEEFNDSVSYLGHKNGFVEEITLRENFNILGLSMDKKLFENFGLNKFKNQKFFNLSYGEKRKAALLRVIQVIGPDKIEDIDDDTFYFIISTLNQLNTDLIRNKLLLKVLPLKV